MSRKGGAKRVVEKTVKDADLNKSFNVMTGQEDPDIVVVIPKYKTMLTAIGDIAGILNNFTKSVEAKKLEAEGIQVAEIRVFAAKLELVTQRFALKPLPEGTTGDPLYLAVLHNKTERLEYQMSEAARYVHAGTGEAYTNLKKHPQTLAITQMHRNIKQALVEEEARFHAAAVAKHAADPTRPSGKPRPLPRNDTRGAKCLDKVGELHPDFLINALGDNLQLFPFSDLCCKNVMLQDFLDAHDRRHFLTILHLLYVHSGKIVKVIMTPDIDIEKFGTMMTGSLKALQTQLPGCDAAFRALESSLDTFSDNFGEYHKDFVASGSPGIILESFVSDVGQKYNSSPVLSAQFKRIIAMYTKRMKSSSKLDPTILKLLNTADETLNSADETSKKNAAAAERLLGKSAPKRQQPIPPSDSEEDLCDDTDAGSAASATDYGAAMAAQPAAGDIEAFMREVGYAPTSEVVAPKI